MAVVLFLVALIAPGFAQNTYYSSCPPSPGQCPCDINDFKTSYVTYGSASTNRNSKRLDNACHAYFPLQDDDPCTFVAYFTPVYSDGSSKVVSFIVTCNSSTDFIFTSPDCSFVESNVGQVGQTSINIRRIISGDCTDIIYPALGASFCPNDGSPSDLAQANQLLSNNGYGCSDLITLPRQYPYQCVTSQPSSNTGKGDTSNCPGSCYDNSPSNYYPSYNYYPPPSNCPYSK